MCGRLEAVAGEMEKQHVANVVYAMARADYRYLKAVCMFQDW